MYRMKNVLIVLFVSLFILLLSVNKSYSQVYDIDSNVYKSVTIGSQEWLAGNLNVSKFRNGDKIPEAKTVEEWKKASAEGTPAWCYFDGDNKNGKVYGKLYNWFAVNDPRGLAPQGWHIPGDEEWTQLIDNLGGEKVAGDKMKTKDEWLYKQTGTNESGFTGLPGGWRESNFCSYIEFGNSGYWWSSTENATFGAWYRRLIYDYPHAFRGDTNKKSGLSVRCVKD